MEYKYKKNIEIAYKPISVGSLFSAIPGHSFTHSFRT